MSQIYGPNTAEVEGFIADAKELGPEDLASVGKGWRMLAVPHPAGSPDVNLHVADAMRAAQTVMALRKLLHDLSLDVDTSEPVPTDDQLVRAIHAGAVAREAIASLTNDGDAIEAIAGMAGVLALQPWIPEPLVENVLAPFVARRPGWLEEARR